MTTLYIEKLNEVYIRVYGDASAEKELSEFFTFEVPGARFMPAYRAKLWDGKIRLYDLFRKTVYAGLFPYVVTFVEKNDYQIEYVANEQYESPLPTENNLTDEQLLSYIQELNPTAHGEPIEVRDYQLEAIRKALNSERTLLLSPTASGKSFIIYCTMRYLLDGGHKCLIVVPSTSLVEQLYSDFEDYSGVNGWSVKQNCQKLYSGFTKDFTREVLITTWQSIYKLPKQWFSQFHVVFGDEAHQFKAKSLNTVMEKMTNVKYRIGTTGTLDNKQVHKLVLEGLFGPVHRVTTTKQLMETQRVAQLNITCVMLKYDEETRKLLNKCTYQQEMDFIVQNEKRNKFIRNLTLNSKGNTLVLFQYVEKQGKQLYELIKSKAEEGRKVFFVYGGTATEEREAMRHIASGEEDAIFIASYGTFSTGINIPSIENIIFASPTKSKIRNLQSIGRGLRLKDGKTHCTLYDLADDLHWKSWKNHTLNHMVERAKIYSEEKFDFKIVEVKI